MSTDTAPENDALLKDDAIAAWFGVPVGVAAKWRIGQKQSGAAARKTPAFTAVARAMGVELPGGTAVPRNVVLAFGKAVGYLDEAGETLSDPPRPRRWVPSEPTIDPVPNGDGSPRKRFYVPHVLEEYGIELSRLKGWQNRDAEFPPGQLDELSRRYWYEADLAAWDEVLRRRDREREAGPPPSGHDEQGRPYRFLSRVTEKADGVDADGRAYRLLPADSYWAQQAGRDGEAPVGRSRKRLARETSS